MKRLFLGLSLFLVACGHSASDSPNSSSSDPSTESVPSAQNANQTTPCVSPMARLPDSQIIALGSFIAASNGGQLVLSRVESYSRVQYDHTESSFTSIATAENDAFKARLTCKSIAKNKVSEATFAVPLVIDMGTATISKLLKGNYQVTETNQPLSLAAAAANIKYPTTKLEIEAQEKSWEEQERSGTKINYFTYQTAPDQIQIRWSFLTKDDDGAVIFYAQSQLYKIVR